MLKYFYFCKINFYDFNMYWCTLLCITIVGFNISGCKEDSQEVLEQTTNSNFTLYVSNQSSARSTIDIELRLDGKLALKDRFHKDDEHNWQQYKFRLSKGKHVLTAFSKNGQAKIEQEFLIEDNHWAVVNYYYSHRTKKAVKVYPLFTFRMENKPIFAH
ncbi:hypothetical protein L0337_23135 [candidate division KSB1 bacterium]|nr:hypothetical protein [candidate division KSB1 bacterium]